MGLLKQKLKLFSKLSIALVVTLGMVTAPLLSKPSADALRTTYTATVGEDPISFAAIEGSGEVLSTALAKYGGKRAVLVGGSFQKLRTPDGVVHNTSNFAILNLDNANEVMYAGTGINGFVRTVYFDSNTIYIGGDFSTVNGVARNRVAAFNTSHQLQNWNPTSGGSVRTIVANYGTVFYGGFGSKYRAVQAPYTANPGALVWEKTFTDGAVRTALINGSTQLYVGGLFETFGGVTQHGLVKLDAATGANNATFKPVFKKDSTPDGHNGDCILALSLDAEKQQLAIGSGGSYRNQMWYISSNTGSLVNTYWNIPGYSTGGFRNSEGDVQAIAMVRDKIMTGYHRSHGNLQVSPDGVTKVPTKRFMSLWKASNGELQNWEAGLWGNNYTINDTEANGGVQSITYTPSIASQYLIVGGTFKGYNKPYLDNGTPDDYFGLTAGPTGVTRNGLQIFPVQVTTSLGP